MSMQQQLHSGQSAPSSGGSSTQVEDNCSSSSYHSLLETSTQDTISNGHRRVRRRRWHRYTCMNTPLEKSGLLYCLSAQTSGLVSIAAEDGDGAAAAHDGGGNSDELMSVLSQAPVTANAIASSIILDRALHFGGKLSQVEETEERYVAQLEHLRDYYMRPLLGQQPARAASRSRGLNVPLLSSIFQRKRSAKDAAQDAEASGRGGKSSDAERQRAQHHDQPPGQRCIGRRSRRTGELPALGGGGRHTVCPVRHAVQDDRAAHAVPGGAKARHHPQALCAFETLVFHNEKLARVIEAGVDARRATASLLTSVLGARPRLAAREPARTARHRSRVEAVVLRRGAAVDARTLPRVQHGSCDAQATAQSAMAGGARAPPMAHSNIASIKEPILTPTQRIFLMDMAEYKLNDVGGTWNPVCIILLRDRMLFLKQRRGQHKQFALKMSILLANTIFTAHERLPNERMEGIYVQEARSVGIKLRFTSRSAFSQWQKYLDAAEDAERPVHARGTSRGAAGRSESHLPMRAHHGADIEFAPTAQMTAIDNLFGLDNNFTSVGGLHHEPVPPSIVHGVGGQAPTYDISINNTADATMSTAGGGS
ncbi:hypothetical protein SYNPS1DRAFT_27370 [Syncephalis pseudoplumigaleata]|uniref:Uncharacterized protein n=1 Tax=Syncephalis pseudoplumigaleata TaxID=1712513 RepID=A0A4P9Z3C6_9FUNG|nr:hypothetical protein SYNPS1DRAFT_27370 [Syncephalis pseudoplumigaleata]|eukprot:RKP26956.1 hypothetical protein SYNPS1DRAFT_27370 [Syncephalis pseudoplumigaleata]